MTAVVGLVHNGTVHLGGDSAGVSGWDLTVRTDPKVFTNGPYAIGFTTSWRMGQVLRWAFKPPKPPADHLDKFMSTTLVDAARDALKAAGFARKDREQEEGGTWLIGVVGRLFTVHGDYQVAESADGYTAVGCGAQVAHGVLYATPGLPPRRRLQLALEAAERHSAGVRGPFNYVKTRGVSQ
jgi:hypothetical protein